MTERQHSTFTDAYIRGLKLPGVEKHTAAGNPYKRAESASRGDGRLLVRVLPSGVKEFFYRYRPDGRDTLLKLGRYDSAGKNGKTLKQIKRALRDKRALQDEHGDVKAYELAKAHQKALEARKGSLRQLLDAYVKSLRDAGKPSADEAEGVFRRHVLKPFPSLASAKAKEIEPGDVQRILARMVNAGIKRQVNVTRAYLRAAFAFGGKADHDPRTVAKEGVLFGLTGNPVITVPRIAEYERAGDRTLAEDELRAYWKALEALPRIQRATLRFNLALACQRPKQLLRADWAAFDFAEKTLLLRDAKGRGGARDHLLPLTAFALEQLEPLRELNSAPDEDGKLPPPFASDGKRPMVVETLSKALAEVSASLKESDSIPKFDQRDLRRTAETMLQKLGIEREVRAHLLSHGRSAGVQGKHYERYDFLKEKRAGLEKWADKLQRIIDPKRKANVLPIRAA